MSFEFNLSLESSFLSNSRFDLPSKVSCYANKELVGLLAITEKQIGYTGPTVTNQLKIPTKASSLKRPASMINFPKLSAKIVKKVENDNLNETKIQVFTNSVSFKQLFSPQGEQLFICEACNHQCNLRSNMVRHVDLKHNPSARKFPCSMCSLQAKFRWQLQTHYVKVHNLSPTVAKAAANES